MESSSLALVSVSDLHKPEIADQETVIHSDLLFTNGDVLFIQNQGE